MNEMDLHKTVIDKSLDLEKSREEKAMSAIVVV